MNETRSREFTLAGKPAVALWLAGSICAILLGWALYATAVVAIPVVFAVLITLLVAPLDRRLKQALPGWMGWAAHLLVMLFLLAILMVLFGALYFAALQALDALPSISDDLNALMPSDSPDEDTQVLPISQELDQVWARARTMFGGWLVDQATAIAQSAATMTGAFFSALVIIFFLVLLLLIELPSWSAKALDLFQSGHETACHDATVTITRRLRRFLVVRTGVGVLQAALYAGWLAIFGIDLLVVWAVLTFILTYIPNLGSLISAALPVLYAFLVKDPMTALWIGAGIFAIEQVVGNFIDPQLQGREIVLSPVVILVSLMFWTWMWGVAGAFLSTPIMLCLLVICHRVSSLRPVSLVLSNQHSLSGLDRALKA